MTVPATSATQPGSCVFSVMQAFTMAFNEWPAQFGGHTLLLQADSKDKLELLEEVTADSEDIGVMEVALSVDLLVSITEEVAGNLTVSM